MMPWREGTAYAPCCAKRLLLRLSALQASTPPDQIARCAVVPSVVVRWACRAHVRFEMVATSGAVSKGSHGMPSKRNRTVHGCGSAKDCSAARLLPHSCRGLARYAVCSSKLTKTTAARTSMLAGQSAYAMMIVAIWQLYNASVCAYVNRRAQFFNVGIQAWPQRFAWSHVPAGVTVDYSDA